MKQYLDLLEQSLDWDERSNRTGINTLSSFGTKMIFDMNNGFPLLTTKRLHWKSIVTELLWFIKGGTNTGYLRENGVTIWDEWADHNGNLGPIYGKQWRKWRKYRGLSFRQGTGFVEPIFDEIDQLQNCIKSLVDNPFDRRHIVNAWNVSDLEDMALPPCHMMYQFYVSADKKYLDIQMYQRSVDIFLGLPYNIASYALLLQLVAVLTGYSPRYYHWVGGDTHLYVNHMTQAEEQLNRELKELPEVYFLEKYDNIDYYKAQDIMLDNYDPHPHIKAEIAI